MINDVNSTNGLHLGLRQNGRQSRACEAGLRSFDRTKPEEVNASSLVHSETCLTPSADADENLRQEGIPDEKIRLVGNIMIDTLMENLDKARRRDILKTLELKANDFVYVTLHRPSNVDRKESLSEIMAELVRLSDQMPVAFPMHPRTRRMLSEFGISGTGSIGLKILDPVGYHDSLYLTERARFVLTDSGGLQEESTFFRTPCLTLRPNTERPVTVNLAATG